MSVLDVDTLLAPISSETPVGENLEYDADYAALEQAAAGKPEQQFGTTVIPAEDPDWNEVRQKAAGLLGRTKDLRVAMYLARGATIVDGLPGMAAGLALLAGLVERYWDNGVHPQLDPDDNNDPALRLNNFAALVDPTAMLRAVREATLVASRGMGKFCYRDVQIAAGELPQPATGEKIEQSSIDGAFADCKGDDLKNTALALRQAIQDAGSLDRYLTDKGGAGIAPSLDPLVELLSAMSKLVEQKLAARGLSVDEAEEPEVPAETEPEAAAETDHAEGNGKAASSGANGRKASTPMSLTGDITTREEVIRALDKICDYYKRYEPSSPVPLFLNRAKRLASKSFLEILRDLTPDAVNQALALSGITEVAGASGGSLADDI